jgi:hypothetical protein
MARAAMTNYPVSSPFLPSQEQAAQTARLRRWTFLLLGAAALLVILTAASIVLWFNLANTTPVADDADGTSPAKRTLPAPAATALPAARLLDALGGLSGAHLSQSSLNLDLLADGVEKNVYTKDEGEKLLATLEDMMKQVDGYLQELRDAKLDPADEQAIERIRKVSGALRAQAVALRAYWKSGTPTERTRYETAREQALDALHELSQKQ